MSSTDAAGSGRASAPGAGPDATVGLSLVVAMYDVERYLPDLLDSILAQAPGPYRLQCVFVDDGSPDRCAEIVERWIREERPAGVEAVLLRQGNGGVSAARNRGLTAATNEWVAFPDPDDALDPRYCAEVAGFLLTDGDTATIVATNLIKYIEAEDRLLDNHSLRFKFQDGARTVPLSAAPHYLQMSASSAFFRRSDLERSGIAFIEGLHASEDALFVAEVLAAAPEAVLGVVPGAIYHYRKRAARDSRVDRYHTTVSTYTDRFDRGYLPLLHRLAGTPGGVPAWFQNQILYELKWLFLAERKASTRAAILSPEQSRAFLSRVAEVLSYVDDALIRDYRVTPMPEDIQQLLLALKGVLPTAPAVRLTERAVRQVEIRYRFGGELPREEFVVDGRVVQPLSAEASPLDYFGQDLLRERRVLLPAGDRLTVRLDGAAQHIRVGPLPTRMAAAAVRSARRRLSGTPTARVLRACARPALRVARAAGGALRGRG
ncbi:MAG: glycosyltransferase [Amnibacterium sp.]